MAHLSLLGAVHGGVFEKFTLKRRHQRKRETPKNKIRHKAAQGCKSDASEVHSQSFRNYWFTTAWPARRSKESSLSNDSMVPCETISQMFCVGNPTCVRTIFVCAPCSMNSTTTRVVVGPKSAW